MASRPRPKAEARERAREVGLLSPIRHTSGSSSARASSGAMLPKVVNAIMEQEKVVRPFHITWERLIDRLGDAPICLKKRGLERARLSAVSNLENDAIRREQQVEE